MIRTQLGQNNGSSKDNLKTNANGFANAGCRTIAFAVMASLWVCTQAHAADQIIPTDNSPAEQLSASPSVLPSPSTKRLDTEDAVVVIVNTAFVDLHLGPNRGYPRKTSVVKGERLQLLYRRGNWVQVLFRGEKLWLDDVHLADLLNQDQTPYLATGDGMTSYQQRSWEGSFLYGDYNGASYYQVSAGYVFSPIVSTELSAGIASGEQAETQLIELSVYLSPFEQWRLSPYFGIGGGVVRTNPKTILVQTPDRTDAIASAELGVKYYLSRNFVARAAYRHGVISTTRNENDESITWKLGFSVFF